MILDEYRRKRKKGSNEPEPILKSHEGDAVFVVQKHAARNLHYDFRIELDGVLKSWAVTKGPSMDPGEKRLAMMVEDHPLDYKDFEGVIPAGHYGAGSVIVWDKGTYKATGALKRQESDKLIRDGLIDGKISFLIDGEKLKGEFALAKIKSAADNSWLMIKKRDRFSSDNDIRDKDQSVVSGKTTEDLQGESEEKNLKSPMPKNINPMLAKLTDRPFNKKGWLFEIKWDGYRCISQIENGKIELYSRHNLSFNNTFKPIVETLKQIQHNAVFDGEVVVLDDRGHPSFELLQNYATSRTGNLHYYIFDLLYLDGFDVRNLSLADRRELLLEIFSNLKLANVSLSIAVVDDGEVFFQNFILKNNLEGMIAKNLNSIYQAGKRSSDWLKVKNHNTLDAVICGFTEGEGGRELGALIVGQRSGNSFKYLGHVGSGFSVETENELLIKLKAIRVNNSPFFVAPKTNAPVVWVEPELVCEIRFTEKTKDGILRHPVFMGLRPDKSVLETELEFIEKPPAIELLNNRHPGVKTIEVEDESLTISNAKKRLWGDENITKYDLATYYKNIAPFILPHLKNRPESLHRFPHGFDREAFYQKNTEELNLPTWAETVDVYSESDNKTVQYLICQNTKTLVYMANLACIEINPWLSSLPTLDRPDFLVIDLDPLNIDFCEVVKVAKICHQLFENLNMPNYCKTSGATGIHIYVPLGAKYTYDESRTFAEIVANLLHHKSPLNTSLFRNPTKRENKVYIDWLQNRKGQTLAAPYSVRPVAGAHVSAPIKWEELVDNLKPSNFRMDNMLERVTHVGELWEDISLQSADLESALKKINES